jgi:aspartyl-tRNA(Asn)/glutamyl-tRNA(Gln) amidotransferase subunit A
MKSNILIKHDEIVSKSKTVVEIVLESIEKNKQYPSTFLAENELAITQAENIDKANCNSLLYGIPYTLKDLYCTKNITTTAGSNILKEFDPMYSSTVYEKLIKAGAILINKSNLDEFGMGGTGMSNDFKHIINPYNESLIVGGSSGGAAIQVSLGIVPFALGTDTLDSIRTPASFFGIVGYKPTYGAISRYGIIPFSPSLDTVGINAQCVEDAAIVANVLCGADKKDMTSINIEIPNKLHILEKINIAIIDGIEDYLSNEAKQIYLDNISKLSQKFNIIKKKFDLKYIECVSPIYMILAYAETSSTLNNLTSIPFGNGDLSLPYNKRITDFRSKNLSLNIKKKLIIGDSFLSSKNYESVFMKAKKVRRVLVNEFNKLMDDVDCLIIPSHSMFAPSKENLFSGKLAAAEN